MSAILKAQAEATGDDVKQAASDLESGLEYFRQQGIMFGCIPDGTTSYSGWTSATFNCSVSFWDAFKTLGIPAIAAGPLSTPGCVAGNITCVCEFQADQCN